MIQTLHHGGYFCALRKGGVYPVSHEHDSGTDGFFLRVGTIHGSTAQAVNSAVNHKTRG